MRAEAGVDEGVFLRLRIEDRELADVLLDREHLGRRMVRTLLAEVRVVRTADRRRQPDPAFAVEHGVVIVDLRIPGLLVAPIGRRRDRLFDRRVARSQGFGHVGIAHRRLEGRDRVRLGIEDRQNVGRIFRRAEQRAIGVDRRIALVGRDQVVQVLLLGAPVPGGDDDVALDALRPRRLAVRQFALGDAVGPVAEILVGRSAKIAGELVDHQWRGLAGHGAAAPRVFSGLELAERGRDGAGRRLAQLMAADASAVLHRLEPVGLRDLFGDVALAAELASRPESSASSTSRSPDSSVRLPRRSAPALRAD